jgi:hypothetical protein
MHEEIEVLLRPRAACVFLDLVPPAPKDEECALATNVPQAHQASLFGKRFVNVAFAFVAFVLLSLAILAVRADVWLPD